MITIGITGCGKWQNYHNWLVSENIETLKLSWEKNNLDNIKKCDGIILSGGEDVHPRFYNKPEYLSLLDLKEINERRDEFELKVIEKTLKDKKPLLGICRGLQIANVYFGGTLIPHLSTSVDRHSKEKGYDQMHAVQVEKNSCLWRIVSNPPPNGGRWRGDGIVNSAHHQAAAQIGNGLVASAFAEDGIVEAMEYKNSNGKSFFLLVQWHPERMLSSAKSAFGGEEQNSSFAKNIKGDFIKSCSMK